MRPLTRGEKKTSVCCMAGGVGFLGEVGRKCLCKKLSSKENSRYGELEHLVDSRYCHIDTLEDHMLGPRWCFQPFFGFRPYCSCYLCRIFPI